MAGAEGFEPPAAGFGDQCSSQAELRSCEEQENDQKVGRCLFTAVNHTLTIACPTANGLPIFIWFSFKPELPTNRLERGVVFLARANSNYFGYWGYEYLPVADLSFFTSFGCV